ncbi:MAG TPA: HDIG domain-containing protein [Anaerolineaceae bacterium]|nr:HDIG domain-containing protein [Anaerolineaceae bacterium]HPN50301.1 HDIG domain-containing protein [Anaerolineaceae bacterium]
MKPALFFDWGDTLMVDYKEFSGPMVTWPKVTCVDGVANVLPGLQAGYDLYVATNASESGKAQVRAALDRAGIGIHFSEIFTARELGLTKLQEPYYPAILSLLDEKPPFQVMTGDHYTTDVLNPQKAGFLTIWFNPGYNLPPDLPWHNAEIHHFSELPAALSQINQPDIPSCLAWLNTQEMPVNLLKHSQAVAQVAYRLALWLKQSGLRSLNPVLAHRGGLLHDLDKLSSRETGDRHGELSQRLLDNWGQPELGLIARRHLMDRILNPEEAPATWEEKLVFFADKLVEGYAVVPLNARFEALTTRYASRAEQIWACLPAVEALQTDICCRLDCSPMDLIEKIKSKPLIFE